MCMKLGELTWNKHIHCSVSRQLLSICLAFSFSTREDDQIGVIGRIRASTFCCLKRLNCAKAENKSVPVAQTQR